jgi:hypothetical protein
MPTVKKIKTPHFRKHYVYNPKTGKFGRWEDKISRSHRDNKDATVGSGNCGSNANTIRFPKKCRKTAWKRFYRLFPHLKNES